MQPIQPPVPSPPPPLLAQISPSVSGVNRLITKNRRNSKGMDGIWPFPTNSLRRYCPRLVKSVYYNAGTSLRIFGLHFFCSGSWCSTSERKCMGRGEVSEKLYPNTSLLWVSAQVHNYILNDNVLPKYGIFIKN